MAHKKRKKKLKLNKTQQILACVFACIVLLAVLFLCKTLDGGGFDPGEELEGETLPVITTAVETQ